MFVPNVIARIVQLLLRATAILQSAMVVSQQNVLSAKTPSVLFAIHLVLRATRRFAAAVPKRNQLDVSRVERHTSRTGRNSVLHVTLHIFDTTLWSG